MNRKGLFSGIISALITFALLAGAQPVSAAIDLLDGKLVVSGFLKNTTYVRTAMYDREKRYRKNLVDHSMNSFLLETLYTINETSDSHLRYFGSYRYWYEMAPAFDAKLKRHMQSRDLKDHRTPSHFNRDILTEAYLDYVRGPLEVRIGKQIVIWGQLDINRVADVVNPLDLRFGVPGVDTWEEIKQGLWMIRTLYQTMLPGMLQFEFIFNPGDYKATLLPYQGTHWGDPYFKNAQINPPHESGFFSYQNRKVLSDMPGWNMKDNYEWGGRIRGFTWGVDWTLLFWDARDDGWIANQRVGDFAGNYFVSQLFLNNPDPAYPRQRVFEFKRYQTVGGTGQTYVDWLKQSVWRLEWFFEIKRPLNLGDGGRRDAVYRSTRADILGIALQGNWKLNIPWLTRTIGTNKLMDFSVTYFWEKVFNYKRDMVLFDRFHAAGESVSESVTLFVMQPLFHQSWTFVFIGNYYPRIDKWMAVPTFSYMFSERILNGGLRLEVGAKLYGGARHGLEKENNLSHAMATKDSIILRLRYEF